MGVYKKAIITDAGEALRARAVAGEANMQFSCAKTSTYVYPEGTDLTKLTDLQEIRQTVVPSNVQITNDTLISVRSLFGNEQISEAYLIQNVGVYATDGENEILFAVCQAITPDQMPAYDGVAPSSFIYNVQLTVSQAAQISLVVNTAGTATTQDVLELEQKKVNGNGGDISETVIAATEKSQAEYPVPAAGDSAKTILGKVQKFFGDLRNWMTGVCLLGQIVNNCVTDNAKLPLSAAQGKVLMDLYNVLNTKRKISDISYIKSSEDVGIERFYLTQHGAVVTMTFSFVLKKSIPQGAYENVIIGYLPSDIKPVQETWPLMGEQGSNKSHQGRVKSNGQIELWCWGADALDKDHIFSCTAVFLVNT